MKTLPTDYSHEQLVDALVAEYEYYCHDSYDEVFDNDSDKYRTYLLPLTHKELVDETCTDEEEFTLSDFMYSYS